MFIWLLYLTAASLSCRFLWLLYLTAASLSSRFLTQAVTVLWQTSLSPVGHLPSGVMPSLTAGTELSKHHQYNARNTSSLAAFVLLRLECSVWKDKPITAAVTSQGSLSLSNRPNTTESRLSHGRRQRSGYMQPPQLVHVIFNSFRRRHYKPETLDRLIYWWKLCKDELPKNSFGV